MATKAEEGPAVECETFHKLEAYMGSDAFLDQLAKAAGPAKVAEQIDDAMGKNIGTGTAATVAQPAKPAPASQQRTGAPAAPSTARASPAVVAHGDAEACSTDVMNSEGFVVIDRQAAVEAMAFYIAETLMRCPQASTMDPKQLQQGVVEAIKGMKQSRFRQACRAGTYAYRWTALGYSAFQMYSNPWIMQAIVTAIMTFTRMTFRPWLL